MSFLVSSLYLDLRDALNAGYLLRLSIVPDLTELDDGITKEFYPEFYNEDGQLKSTEEILFEGKLMMHWWGYSEEVTNGRLLQPKIDYLQASLVQRAAAWVKKNLALQNGSFQTGSLIQLAKLQQPDYTHREL